MVGFLYRSILLFTVIVCCVQAQQIWRVWLAGESDPQHSDVGYIGQYSYNRFYPSNLTINAGDKVHFVMRGPDVHTITHGVDNNVPPPGFTYYDPSTDGSDTLASLEFNLAVLMPSGNTTHFNTSELTGSGALGPMGPGWSSNIIHWPHEWNVTFATEGTYKFMCIVHQEEFWVTVNPAGTAYPKTQEQIDAEGDAQLLVDIAHKNTYAEWAKSVWNKQVRNIDGTITHNVMMGLSDEENTFTSYEFIPKNLTITQGDTIKWTNWDVFMPHTVTFLANSSDKVPDMMSLYLNQMPPRILANPVVVDGTGHNGWSFVPDTFINSGMISGYNGINNRTTFRSFSLTFNDVGLWTPRCIVHHQSAMRMNVTVVPYDLSTTGSTDTTSSLSTTTSGLSTTTSATSASSVLNTSYYCVFLAFVMLILLC